MKVDLLIIDPQNDFCHPSGALSVPNADKDMDRLATLINKVGDRLNDIHVTLDSHRVIDVSHPSFWVDENGQEPKPFTKISTQELKDAKYKPRIISAYSKMIKYSESLDLNGRYNLMIYPEHCLIGSEGHCIYPSVRNALTEWERKNIANVNYITKGSNSFHEHYSAIQAEVVDPSDPSTSPNMRLIQQLEKVDRVYICGEALSHCVRFTIEDIVKYFNQDHLSKLYIIMDCSSVITGFEKETEDFIEKMKQIGLNFCNSTDVLC